MGGNGGRRRYGDLRGADRRRGAGAPGGSAPAQRFGALHAIAADTWRFYATDVDPGHTPAA